jgi:ATP synthase F1 complex assembly factor 2
MPFTTLCCTSLDLAMSGTEGDVERYRESCLRYLHNDTLAYWADGAVERPLRQRQERLWKPILDAFEEEWGHRIAVVEHDVAGGGSMIMRGSRSGGNGGGTGGLRLDHPEELRVACTRWVDEELDAWHLVALYSLAAEAKSFVLAWALLAGRLGLEDKAPVEACRVEEEFQISNWGMVEGGHDYDRLNCSIQLHAAVLLKDFIAFELGAPGLGSEQQRKA